MTDKIPIGKFRRSYQSGKTASKIAGKAFVYKSKKPFLNNEKLLLEKNNFENELAEIIFKSLSQLKGTALKLAQLLSLELDILPESIRNELKKSYHQVPPINRALIRNIIFKELGKYPENIFKEFNDLAFAAASLGQVHYVKDKDNKELALKVQYPGIKEAIHSDMKLLKMIFKTVPDLKNLIASLNEIEERLIEETDYIHEVKTLNYFKSNLKMKSVKIPQYHEKYSTARIICTDFINANTLDGWLKTSPKQEDRNRIANLLCRIFLKSLYELNIIHADPNPGNFLILENKNIVLIDFGCSKKLDSNFVNLYKELPQTIINGDRKKYKELLIKLKICLTKDENIINEIVDMLLPIGLWLSQSYKNESFNFKNNPNYINDGKKLMQSMFKFRKNLHINPDFIFLDRTRYGLFRLFEQLGADVKIRNEYENY